MILNNAAESPDLGTYFYKNRSVQYSLTYYSVHENSSSDIMDNQDLKEDDFSPDRRYSSDHLLKFNVASGAKDAELNSDSPTQESLKERVWTVAACALIACLASLVNVGMMLGFSSPALKQLQFDVSEDFQISNTDIEFSLFGVNLIMLQKI